MPSVVVAPLAPRPLAVVHGRLTPDVEAVKKEKKDDDVCSSFVINAVVAVGVMVALLLGLFLFVVLPHLSQTAVPTGSYRWPPPAATSQLGKFRRAAVTTDHGLCSEIGRNVLIQGGNAVDSAVAVQFCLGVTNPQSAGLGGGFIMTIYNRSRSACEVIDARETAPAATHRDVFVNDPDGSKYGFRAVGVPGELAGLWMAFKRFGSGRVPWRSLLQPSIDLCKNGVPVSEYLAVTMQTKEYHFHLFPSMRDWINPRTNRSYEFGDLMPRPKLASTLERLAAATDPERLFYQGDMADTLAREFKRENGFITKEDLASYRARLHQKAEMNDHFHPDLVMCGPPPPSSFSVTQLIISVMAQIYPKANKSELYTSALFYHRFIEAMKFGYAQRTLLGDGDFVPKALKLAEKLTTRAATEEVLRKMNSKALPTADYGGVTQFQPPDHGTAHVSVIDAEGNGVSSTTTINRWFGAAVQSESLGIVWNDEMDDFSTPGTANGFGFAPSETNFIAPGKRPMSSMSPMVVFNKHTKNLRMVIGGSGGSKIISALSKAVIRVLLFGETIKEAIDAPMLHNQFTPDITQTDEFFPTDLRDELEQIFGQKFRNTSGFEGIIQGISVEDDAIYASGDFRRKTNQHAEGY